MGEGILVYQSRTWKEPELPAPAASVENKNLFKELYFLNKYCLHTHNNGNAYTLEAYEPRITYFMVSQNGGRDIRKAEFQKLLKIMVLPTHNFENSLRFNNLQRR